MKFVLIPVKNLKFANERLSSVLSQESRTALAYAMLQDVYNSAVKSMLADKVAVVTMDKKAISMAEKYKFLIIEESKQESESSSVDYAVEICGQLGADSVLVIPADAPLITAEDIDSILEKVKDPPHVILVPSGDKLGTNAILRNPPNVLKSMFGHDSFRKHREQAEEKRVPYEIYEMRNFALDIDRPEDVEILKKLGRHTLAYGELVQQGLIENSIKTTG